MADGLYLSSYTLPINILKIRIRRRRRLHVLLLLLDEGRIKDSANTTMMLSNSFISLIVLLNAES
jgi:hypothetical protein